MDINEKNNGNDTNVGSIENSIEEDIKLLREMKNNCLNRFEYYTDPKAREKAEAIERILSDYKRTLKKNEKLKEELETEQNERLLCYIREKQMIPVQKIKDKIEELKEKSGGNVFHIQQTINAEIRLLKELIEESAEKIK